jgi:hypothetical protein
MIKKTPPTKNTISLRQIGEFRFLRNRIGSGGSD